MLPNRKLFPRFPGHLLAGGRLALMLGVTVFCMLRLAFHQMVSGRSARTTHDHARRWSNWMLDWMGIRLSVTGSPPSQPVLLVSNHRSYLDVVALASNAPCFFLAKQELLSWPVLGHAVRMGQAVTVQRECADSRGQARSRVADMLGSGLSVAVFPEGTTHAGPGILPFRPGLFHVAAQGGHAVMPVAVEVEREEDAFVGEDSFLSHFMRVFSRPKIEVALAFGPVLQGADPERLRAICAEWISDRLPRIHPDRLAGARYERIELELTDMPIQEVA